MELMSNNHSVFMLHYHLILVVKYRRKVITDEISRKLGIEFEKVCENYNIGLEDWNHDIDHVHILFNANPNTNISKFINAYKSASSRIIKKEFPEIKQQLWKQNFWSTSFCLISTGRATIEVIKKYIESQGE
ncbi:MAG: IS200/IS605 family transposase [Clostridia bacterium]|nr:IS200/IS605 family transposase [Clostridia bacterium]